MKKVESVLNGFLGCGKTRSLATFLQILSGLLYLILPKIFTMNGGEGGASASHPPVEALSNRFIRNYLTLPNIDIGEFMNISIKTRETISPEDSFELTKLGELIEREVKQNVRFEKVNKNGIKSGGLTIGIEITGFIFSGISTLISILLYWKSQNPKYSVTLKRGDYTLKFENLKKKEFIDVVKKIESQRSKSNIEIIVTKE